MTRHWLDLLLYLYYSLYLHSLLSNVNGGKEKLFLWLFGFNLFLSFWYGFWWYRGWNVIKEHVEIMRTFNFSRFHFFTTVFILWTVCTCDCLFNKKK